MSRSKDDIVDNVDMNTDDCLALVILIIKAYLETF